MSHSSGHTASTPRLIAWIGLGTAVFSFTLGACGFALHDGTNFLDSIYNALQLFDLHFHSEHASAEGDAPRAGAVFLEVARFGAAAVGLALVPTILGLALFRMDIFRLWVRLRWSHHIVVCGTCTRTLSLIRDTRLRYPQMGVVFIGRCPRPPSELPSGVLYLEGEAPSGDLLATVGLQRAKYLVALHEDDRANLEIMVAAERICGQHQRPAPLECYAHVQDTHLQIGLHQTLGRRLAQSNQIRPNVFNYYETVARNLACQYPLPEALVEDKSLPEHYVIVGFGSFGQNVALKLVKMGQQLVHRRLRGKDQWSVVKPQVTVVDPQGERATAPFLRSHPDFLEQCSWMLQPYSCEDPEFLDLTFLDNGRGNSPTSIIFCLENEALTLRTALLIRNLCRATQKAGQVGAIYLRLAHPEKLDGIVNDITAHRLPPDVVFFAPDQEIFSADAILRFSVDTLARAVHQAYLTASAADARANNKPTAGGTAWENLPENDREGNREAADHTWAKLRTLGYELRPVPPGASAPPVSDALVREINSQEDDLARAEHYRWMTWRLLGGWTYGPKRTTPEEIAAGKPKHHPDLVPYEKLNPAIQDKDKVIIRAIPQLMTDGHLQATKR